MTKLAKYLKPFLFGLLLAIALLFGQAMCDLNLPNYMSDIVNVGILQNGIEHAAPDAISENGYKLITALMTDEDKQLVEECYYDLLEKPEKLETPRKHYPNISPGAWIKKDGIADDIRPAEPRKKLDAETLNRLDEAFGRSTVTLLAVMEEFAEQSGQTQTADADNEIQEITPERLNQIYGMLPMLAQMSPQKVDDARAKAADYDPMMLKMGGIVLAKAFYTELGVDFASMQSAYITHIGLILLLIAIAGGLASVAVGFISSKIATGVARNIRKDIFAKVENFSHNEFDKFSTASLITRSTNDITHIQMLLLIGIRMVCYAPIMAVGGVMMAVSKSASMSWIIAAAAIALLGIMMVVLVVAMPKFKLIQKLVDRLNLVSRENLSGMMVIRAFGTQKHETERFDHANKDLTRTMLFVNRVMVTMMPFMMLLMNGISLLVIWVGAHQVADSTIMIGDMMAFMQYAIQVIFSFMFIAMMFIMVPRAAVSAERIAEVLGTEISIKDPENPKAFDANKKGLVEFKDVCFRYQNAEEDAVSGITFTAKPGEMTAIIGSTGSGKSTVANLIMRFYDVSGGEILVDGVDVREARQHDLRNKIGYVPQKGVLLTGTVASNIRYGRQDASDADVEEAAKVAQAQEFIGEMSEKFDSEIAQGGGNVSGGQKQRLSIARALAKNPEILIFDDSFSALDFKTDAALRRALKEHTADATMIVVAQRVGTVMNAEQIIVLNEGRIVGKGTHRELLQNCPEYLEIASSQLSKEELA